MTQTTKALITAQLQIPQNKSINNTLWQDNRFQTISPRR